ncbi:hypothetical protein Y032_0075g940 [Ancylostoma ceylanicum]|uniref:Uncharacterized protein n=1 Tax=Ancylostoma ceylanicum TaxID=53326 RepID=A0A016TU45_9BILA|nr:hypothetical protein Y032_0075g940 [Ancylostoma ceylanicum]
MGLAELLTRQLVKITKIIPIARHSPLLSGYPDAGIVALPMLNQQDEDMCIGSIEGLAGAPHTLDSHIFQ